MIDGQGTCNEIVFGQNKLEELLDSYGLLLFKTYNEDGNCFKDTSPQNGVSDCREGTQTATVAANRTKSILLPKSSLTLDSRRDQPEGGFFFFDNRREIKQRLSALRAGGIVLAQNLGKINLVSTDFNNNNGQITPGEVIGIALNLYNDANTPMGGVQVFANDWDHIKVEDGESKMCGTFADALSPPLPTGELRQTVTA